jgi:hypothetical protein
MDDAPAAHMATRQWRWTTKKWLLAAEENKRLPVTEEQASHV